MPIPKPRDGESQSAFVARCIEFVTGEGTDTKQAAAICYDQWRKNKSDVVITSLKSKHNKVNPEVYLAGRYPED